MPEKYVPTEIRTTDRYVSADSPRRAVRALFALIAGALILGPAPGFADDESPEEPVGKVEPAPEQRYPTGQLTKQAKIYESAAPDAKAYGKLPKGTLLELVGPRRGQFYFVQVELEKGKIKGWVRTDYLIKRRGTLDDPGLTGGGESIRVPEDEALLLRREATFFYGPIVGAGLDILIDGNGLSYSGMMYDLGGMFGYYLSQTLTVGALVSYSSFSASNGGGTSNASQNPGVGTNTGPSSISFGLFNVGVLGSYHIARVELTGELIYGYGSSVTSIPTTVPIKSAADLSAIWGGAGVGYHWPLGEFADFAAGARYRFALGNQFLGMQTVYAWISLAFHG